MRKPATSVKAVNALFMLSQTQNYFVNQLTQLCTDSPFTAQQWLRDNDQHGGGLRFVSVAR